MKFAQSCILARVILAFCLLGAIVYFAAAEAGGEEDYPDIFAREDTNIGLQHTVGRVVVTNGDAVIGGRVTRGVVVANGNLQIGATAHIKGYIVVLNGKLFTEQGADIERTAYVLPASGPGAILGTGLIGMIGIFLVLFLIFSLVKKTGLTGAVKKLMLTLENRWPLLYIVLTLAFSALMLWAFSELAWKTIFRHQLDFFDNVIIWLVRYHASPLLDQTMIYITTLGTGHIYGAFAIISLAVQYRCRLWLETAALTVCLAGGAILNFVLKQVFERARPEMFHVISETGYSFPSGHAMVSLCFYGMLAFLISRHITSAGWRTALLVLAALLVFAIGISRIYLGVHYPSDVVAGYAAGLTWLFFCVSLLMWYEHKRCKND